MAYSDFTLKDIKTDFMLEIEEGSTLFAATPVSTVPDFLRELLQEWVPLAHAIGTEKARSEFIIAPVLATVKKMQARRVGLFSGVSLNVAPEQGLNGVCGFILSLSSEPLAMTAPLVMLVEAKNENINLGLPQCMAEMIAARLFNEQEKNPLNTIYGCVTTGTVWKFLRYREKTLWVDRDDYYIRDIDKLLGIFNEIVSKLGQ
jgi:hypothetical protein